MSRWAHLLTVFFLFRGTLSLEPFGFVDKALMADPRTHVGIVVQAWYVVPTWTIHF